MCGDMFVYMCKDLGVLVCGCIKMYTVAERDMEY